MNNPLVTRRISVALALFVGLSLSPGDTVKAHERARVDWPSQCVVICANQPGIAKCLFEHFSLEFAWNCQQACGTGEFYPPISGAESTGRLQKQLGILAMRIAAGLAPPVMVSV
jgi:hypothetical protein